MFKDKNLKNLKNKIAIIENDKKISYQQLFNLAEKITIKIKHDSLVFLMCKNNIISISMYIGLLKKNCKIVLLDLNIDKFYLKKLISRYKPNYILFSENKEINFNSQKYKIENKSDYLVIFGLKKKNYIKINKKISILLSTSGTTGNPKFVMITRNNLKDNTVKIIKSLKKIGSVITTLPMQYSYGLSIINTHLFSGQTVILNNLSILDSKFIKLYKKYLPNCFYGVPFMFEILLKIKFKFIFHKNLFFLANAGGKIEKKNLKQIMNYCKKNNSKFFSMYGQTEASPRMAINDCMKNDYKFSSIGNVLNEGKFKIIKNNKFINKPNIIGELTYRGKNVFLGYAESHLDLSKKKNIQILYTGDLAKYDKDKYIYIVGRKKRIIKLFGIRLNLDDIEKLLFKYKNCICKCEFNDEKLIINRINKKIDDKSLVNFLSKKLKINKNYIVIKIVNPKKIYTTKKQ